MKIIEILEQYDTVRKEKTRQQAFNYDSLNRLGNADNRRGGAGWYSRGVPHPTDPHTFIKSTKYTSKLNNDAFHKYVEMITALRKKGIENPYFPAVYEIKITRDPNQSTRPQYHLQALKNFREFDKAALVGMYERMFGNYDELDDTDTEYDIWRLICNNCKEAAESKKYGGIVDDQLKQALKYVGVLYRKYKYDLDMHSGNFMIRATSTGPQLVITDPVSDSGRSIPLRYEVDRGPHADQDANLKKVANKKRTQRTQEKPAADTYCVVYKDSDDNWHLLTSFSAVNQKHAQAKWDQFSINDSWSKPKGYSYYRSQVVAKHKADALLQQSAEAPAEPRADAYRDKIDDRRNSLNQVKELAQRQGYVTYEELEKILTPSFQHGVRYLNIIDYLTNLGIKIVGPEGYDQFGNRHDLQASKTQQTAKKPGLGTALKNRLAQDKLAKALQPPTDKSAEVNFWNRG
jgi:hypothetical protein